MYTIKIKVLDSIETMEAAQSSILVIEMLFT